ncbi:thioredoxin-like protein 1 [Dinothrombium tinctorium]|uniref:Thioredoxin-like protein 1 n=1 Tax=Dinothrombium tinctorium TaxID=1965070 RepID=A0A443R877_9ACAR|nr:thioredoxin-like protein 1 [Dinothrombium tinctorium]
MVVIVIEDDSRFQNELGNAANNLAVVDFTASWCGPCQRIAPVFEELSNKYSRGAVFFKVDVDRCPDTAASQSVNSMPTFIFYRNRVKLARIQGADPQGLESKIQELIGNVSEDGSSDSGIPGHIDLSSLISKADCECLNESDEHPFSHCLTPGSSQYLESDCDEQLIISIGFSQNVKLHSIKIHGPLENGPKTVKFFINQPRTLGFDQAESMEPIQTLELSPKELVEGAVIPLRYVKFQNVQNLQMFVKDNQSGSDVTRINYIGLVGSPLSTTNMSDFKRIAGKKGESH